MKKAALLIAITILAISADAQKSEWKAERITSFQSQSESNTWLNFVKNLDVHVIPDKAMARIAVDSKYWMWINGEMVVFEGQLKRGPTPRDTYYDEVDIAPFLKAGQNRIAILVWYFGKDGFSHNSSGLAGLAFQCDALELASDASWQSRLDPAFESTQKPHPNFRLSESNVRFNATYGDFSWIDPGTQLTGFRAARLIGKPEDSPWNKLVIRPTPQWKNYGIRDYENQDEIPAISDGSEIVCNLPYNCHITPILEIDAPREGMLINMQTDNFDYMGLNVASVRAEYVTKEGPQQYESPGWMNGHVVKYHIPAGVKIKSLKYRETGFDCEFTGYFNCSDPFYNKLWTMAARTLYVTMRDTYMDCPDRERAQWWGDMVNESGEAFYALSPPAATITEKGIKELIFWQRSDGTIYSPVPEGNYDKELPGQMLASVGYYGFWTYYWNTGDKQTMADVYKGMKGYLDVWEIKENGTLVHREGDWYWGDWGNDIDKQLLFNAWYYLALKGYYHMSVLLEEESEAEETKKAMKAFHSAFNEVFWDGTGYRTAEYKAKYDDRAQALAVVSGLADKEKYDEILDLFKEFWLASPYMEKYILEALFIMGEDEFGLYRMKERYYNMVEKSPFTTLYENFGPRHLDDKSGFIGHGSNNHAWSGGGLTILSQYVCGLETTSPAWKTFRVRPQLGDLEWAETGNETLAGKVAVRVEKDKSSFIVQLEVPEGTQAMVCIPEKYRSVEANGTKVYLRKSVQNDVCEYAGKAEDYNQFRIGPGTHKFKAR